MCPGNTGTPRRIARRWIIASGSGPVGEEAAAVPGVGEDVHEDVGRALLIRVVTIVVHRHEVARRDRAGNDTRRRDFDHHRGQRVTDLHRVHSVASGTKTGRTTSPSNASNRTCTGMPIDASSGVDVHQVAHEPHAFLELDQCDDVPVVEERQRRMTRHHEAVDGSAPRRVDHLPLEAVATRAHRPRRMAQRRRTRRNAGSTAGRASRRPRRTGCRPSSTGRVGSSRRLLRPAGT